MGSFFLFHNSSIFLGEITLNVIKFSSGNKKTGLENQQIFRPDHSSTCW